jgi:Ser/Thr protein kinase RdoA (MazF antagonist)
VPTIDQDLRRAAAAFFSGPYSCTLLGTSSGFSGSTFARVETNDGAWCLRRWPLETAPATLSLVHAVLRHSRSRGFRGVPCVAATAAGETVVSLDDFSFDAQEWVAGAALTASTSGASPVPNPVCPLSSETLVQVAVALADFHRSTSDLSPPPEGTGAFVHGDLWAPRVFFSEASFTGFIDFESLAWDAPSVDLAQLILHFNDWDERAAVLEAYGDHRALTATDHALLPAAAVLDLAGEGLWSLGFLAAAAGQPPHRDRHIGNLRELFPSLNALSGS